MLKINGLLIDCARTIEKHDYYFRLVDFMADWGMNTLLFHFTDDQGCAVVLPGFEKLASPNAFSAAEIRELVRHAEKRGIEIIPELETFGHTRYLTDHPDYAQLKAGHDPVSQFNCVDPVAPETGLVMDRLIQATRSVFVSPRLHLGCDEVGLGDWCEARGLVASDVWTDYVNRIVGIAQARGCHCLLWADHPAHHPAIAARLRKDVTLVHWYYEKNVKTRPIASLVKHGFKDIITAPAIACWRHRFVTSRYALENTGKMIRLARTNGLSGVITTAWCPFRYLQGSLYYGIAYAAMAAQAPVTLPAFRAEFAKRVWGPATVKQAVKFLRHWELAAVTHPVLESIFADKPRPGNAVAELTAALDAASQAVRLAESIRHESNTEIFNAMVLAAQAVKITAEILLAEVTAAPVSRQQRDEADRILKRVEADWNITRFANDPGKQLPDNDPNGNGSQYITAILRRAAKGPKTPTCKEW